MIPQRDSVAAELDETEPPLKRHLIQYAYLLRNQRPNESDYLLAKEIATKVLGVWAKVNPRLPLKELRIVTNVTSLQGFFRKKEIIVETG